MKQILPFIFCVTIFVVGLFTGFPLEIFDPLADRIARFILVLLIIFSFYKFFQFGKNISNKIYRTSTLSFLVILSIPYFLICLYNFGLAMSENYETWEDSEVFISPNKDKIVHQFRRTSFALHDSRTRKILKEYNSFRISVSMESKSNWTL